MQQDIQRETLSWNRKPGAVNPMHLRMVETEGRSLPLLEFPVLRNTGLVTHGFSTRIGGVSTGIYGDMNLGWNRGDRPEAVKENYRRMAAALGISMDQFVLAKQTHTCNVRRVTRAEAGMGVTRERDFDDTDGLMTDVPGLMLTAFGADCCVIYLLDPVHRAIALSHSGWRGTVGRMGAITVKKMEEAYGSRPTDLLAAISPSICQDCYEISEDVAVHFQREFPESFRRFLKKRDRGIPQAETKYQLNLWGANQEVLKEAGLPERQIFLPDLCTCCNPSLLFSHRASGGKRGNNAAFLMLKE